jgi:hypothetical protein
VIIFHPHRNSSPFINEENRKKYVFVDPNWLWKFTFLFGRTSKLRDYATIWILNIINPKFIVDINWIAHIHTIYYVWCKKNNKKFIVIQHGTYVGGVVTDAAHRFTKCQEFWVWSDYFKIMFSEKNKGKAVSYRIVGNPVYNNFDRDKFSYKSQLGKKILVAPSFVDSERFAAFEDLIKTLDKFGYEVVVKEHVQQSARYKSFDWKHKTNDSFYQILEKQLFDFVVTDVSSAMNDIIFFKNRALFFSPPSEKDFFVNNLYSNYLQNLNTLFANFQTGKLSLESFSDIIRQEDLLVQLAYIGKPNNL